MIKIIKSLVLVVAALAVVGGGTRSFFSDTDSFDNNTISTATVKIDARNEPQGRLSKPLNVSGLVPGQWTDYARGIVFNEANSTNVKLYMYVTNISGVACGKTNLEVWTGHAGNGADSERGWNLFKSNIYDFNGPSKRVEITGKVFNPTIGPNNSAVIQQRAQLDSSADNDYQNKSCTWDEIFVAETVH